MNRGMMMGRRKILTAMMQEESLEAMKTSEATIQALIQEKLAEQRKRRRADAFP